MNACYGSSEVMSPLGSLKLEDGRHVHANPKDEYCYIFKVEVRVCFVRLKTTVGISLVLIKVPIEAMKGSFP